MSGVPLIGTFVARVLEVAPVAIHGDVYYDTSVLIEVPGNAPGGGGGGSDSGAASARVRIAGHVCAGLPSGRPEAGQRLSVHVLMQQVTRVELAR